MRRLVLNMSETYLESKIPIQKYHLIIAIPRISEDTGVI
jgi:hypothetical protein